MTTLTTPTTTVLSRDRWFFTGMTLLMLVTAFAGFAPSFYLRSPNFAGPPLTSLVIFHAVLMTIWLLGTVLQTSFIATGNKALHRAFGWVFATVALLIVATGPQLGIAAIQRGAVPPVLTAEQFLILPMAGALMFAIFVTAGVLQRNIAQAHKRLMLLATISVMDAAIARLPGVLEGGPLALFGIPDLFIVAGIVYDRFSRGRVHPVWIYGGLAIVISQIARLVISSTATWASVVHWLVG